MKDFKRSNQLLSLCGLNCGLCPMYLGKHCLGCGNGNQSCKIARCSLTHGNVEYCYACGDYPCERYEHIDEFDSFISHKNQKADLEKAKTIGIEAYNGEQTEKIKYLNTLLQHYNDGRKKNFYCVAVNTLSLSDLNALFAQVEAAPDLNALDHSSRCKFVFDLFTDKAKALGIDFKLRKKKQP